MPGGAGPLSARETLAVRQQERPGRCGAIHETDVFGQTSDVRHRLGSVTERASMVRRPWIASNNHVSALTITR